MSLSHRSTGAPVHQTRSSSGGFIRSLQRF
jgi:hypothetical protein